MHAGTALPAIKRHFVFEFRPILSNDDPLRPRSQRAPPGEPGAIKDARAPPAFSI